MAETRVRGTITFPDGSESDFEAYADYWEQHGATTERLGRSVDFVSALPILIHTTLPPEENEDA